MSRHRLVARALAAAALVLAPAVVLAQATCAPLTQGSASWSGIVNTYYPGTSSTASAGSTSIGVGSADARGSLTAVATGDLLLIVQVQDASISTSNSSAYGGSGSGQGYTSLGSSGLFEYAVAAGPVSGGSIPLAMALQNTYHTGSANGSNGQKRYEVIRVPQASSATLTGTLTAPAWDGNTGGIVAIDVAGNLNWNGQTIDVQGRGFRGGGGQSSTSDGTGAPVNASTDYVSNVGSGTLGVGVTGSVPNGAKGEGIAGTPIIVFTPTNPNSTATGTITNTGGTDGVSGGYPVGSFGRGAPGNGGGGGTDGDEPANDQNTGGAGGGNYGIGGKGGFGWTPGTPPGWDGGGFGGMSVPGGTTRLFFGGGGGAGSTNNATGTPGSGAASSGAPGGGMVFVRAGSTTSGVTINAQGTAGNTSVLNDASGGGGAGGSVLVFVDNNGASIGATINIQGGNGGCNTGGGTFTGACQVPTGGSPHGPGGGGSGGFALLSGNATVNVAGGANGVTALSSTSTSDYGSTSSVGGFQIVSLSGSQIPGSGSDTSCFPQLTVTKATSTPVVAAGAAATYTITVANAANKSAATGVSITDVLPGNPNITFASNSAPVLTGGATRTATVNPAAGATSPTWGTFTIPGGASVALTFLANTAVATPLATYQNPATVTYLDPTRTASQTVTPGGTYTAGGTVGGSNYNPASSPNEDVTLIAAPTLTKAFNPKSVAVGTTSVLTVTITNPSATPLTGGGLIDNYPAAMVNSASPSGATTCGGTVTAAPGGTSFTLSGATFPATTSCTVTVNVKTTAPAAYTNTLPVGAITDAQGVSNTVAASGTLYTDVTVAKSFSPNAVAPNAASTVSLVLTNPNNVALTLANPGLVDTFPANLVAAGGAVTVTGTNCTGFAPTTLAANATGLTLTAGSIPPNSSCTVSFAVQSATTGIYANTSSGVTTVEAGTTGPASNTASLGVGLINIAEAFAPGTIASGGNSTLTFTLTNPTGVAQTNGTFSDALANMSVAANQTTGGTCAPTTALTAGQTALSFSGLNIPAAGCTITLTVTSSTVGAQTNAAGGVSTALLPAGPAASAATLNVLGKPGIAKAFSPATIAPNGTSTLTFTLTNPGPVALTGASFTDSYGATGLVNATPLTVGGSCTGVATSATAGGNTFNLTAATIPANASCTITVTVTASAVGSYNNTASAVATNETGAGVTGSNTATLNVANPPTIAKAFGTNPIAQGATSVITFTLTNGNSIALTNLGFTDALSNMSVASPATIGGTCAGTTNSPALVAGATSLNLTVPSLAAGASCTVTVPVTSSISGTWSNTTSGVTSAQTAGAGTPSNTATLTVLSPPSLTKGFVPSSIQTGATSVMTFTLTNPNASTALTNASFTDALSNMSVASTTIGGTCAGTTNTPALAVGATALSLSVPSIAGGASCTVTITVTSSVMSPATGHPNTTGTVSSTETAVNPGAAATGNLIVYAPPTIAKTFSPTSIASGGTSTVTFTLTNPNALGLTNIRFTDNLPTNLSNTAAQTFIGGARGTCTGTIPTSKASGAIDPITFSSTNLGPGASCTILMDVTSSTVGFYTNTVTNILSDQTPTATTGGSDNLSVGRVTITKAFSASSAQTNGTATLTFTITNSSGGNRTGLTFTDSFPAGMAAVGGAVTTGGTCTSLAPTTIAANATAYNLTALSLNNNVTCTISFPVKLTSAGTKSNTVTGTAPTQFNGATDTATITVFDAPTIAKSFSPSTIAAGGTSTLTFTLDNPNAFAALTGAAFTDTLANMAVSGAQSVGGTCAGTTPSSLANGATALSFTAITIPAGGNCTVTVVVSSSTPGVQPNTASGVTTTQTPTAGTGSGAVNLTVAGINLSKAFAPTSRPLGVPTTLTFTLSSTQSVAWTGLTFTDTLAPGLVVANPANAVTTCGAGTVTAVAGTNGIALSGGTMASGASPCTVSVDVVSNAAATYTNDGTNLGGLSPGVAFSGPAASIQYFNNATLTKAFGAPSIAASGTTTLTFTLANPAGSPAVSGLGFTDTFPAGLVVAGTPGASNTCGATFAPSGGAGSVALSGASLGAGPSTCTATVSVTSSVLGNYVNNASNFSALAGGLTATGASATLAVVGTSLSKQFAPSTIGVNAVSTLTFTIANGTGNPAQSALAFTDTLPTNVVVASPANVASTCGSATAAPGSAAISLSGGSMTAGTASCTISVDVTSAQAGTYVNAQANVSGASAGLDTSAVNATLNVLAQPTATKAFGAAFLAPGGATTLTLTFSNANSTAVAGLAFTDTFPVAPAAMTLANAASTNTCGGALTDGTGGALAAGAGSIKLAGGTIPANGSCAITVNVTAPSAGAYTNTIPANTITSTNGGKVPTATSASITVPSAPTIAKAFANPIGPGRTVTLTFTLTNPNAGTALSGVAFADTFPTSPAAMVVASPANAATSGCGTPTFAPTAGAASISFSGGSIAASGTCTVSVDVTAPSAGSYANTSGAVSATGPVALTGGTASATLPVTQPTLAKAFSPAAVDVNATSTLVFTLTNGAGNPAQSGIDFTDTLPANVVTVSPLNISSTCPSGAGAVIALPASGTIQVSGATMSGGQASCTISVDVRSATAGTYNNTSANLSAVAHVDASGVNATLTVQSLPALTKAFAASTVGLAQSTTLAFTVDNSGATSVARAGLSFTDTLPAGITIANPPAPGASASCGSPTFTAVDATQPFTAAGISIAAGQVCTITVGVRGTALGAAVNGAAQITAANGVANAVTSQTLTVVQPSVAKTFAAASINDTAATSLVFTLANGSGNPAQGGIALGDTLPTGLRFASATPAVAYSAGCSGAASAAYNSGTRVLSGLTGIAMSAGTASCTVTVSGVTNASTQVNASCAGNPAAFTNLAANVTATHATPAGSDQCLVVNAIAPSAAKTFGAASIADGATTTLVFTLANQGSNPAQSGIALGDTLPSGLAFNSATPAVAYSAGCAGPASASYNSGTRVLSGLTGITMAGGTASCTVTVSGVTNQATQVNASCAGNPAAFTNLAANVATTGAANVSTDQCLVVARANPTVAKTFGAGSIADGAATTMVFTLTNAGTNPAQSAITVGDTLPTGLAFNSATPAVAYSAGCSGPASAAYNSGTRVLSGLSGVAMSAGTASCTVTVSGVTNQAAQVNASCAGNPAAFTNLAANVTATNATPGGSDQCLVVNRANPGVAKTFGAASVNDGAATTLVFTLTNSGTNPAQSGVAVGDTLPSGLALNSATPAVAYSAGCSGPASATYNSGTRVLSGLTGIAMTAGTASCTATVSGLTNQAGQVNASCAGNPAAFTNLASSVTTTGANNTSSDQCLVVNRLNASVAKTFGAGTIVDGAATTLVFTLANSGTNPAQSAITLGDTLPTGLALGSATPAVAYSAGCSGPASAAYNSGTRVLSGLTGIAMTSGTASCTVTVAGLTNQAAQVNASCAGNPAAFTNLAANITATNATPAGSDQCLVVTRGTPTVAKTFGAASINDVAATTLVFTLANSGTNPAQSAIALGDTLPTGLAINSATPAVAYSAGCSGPATASYNPGTRVLSGLTGIAMTAGTASCTVAISGLTNQPGQVNASCAGNPAAFTNLAANVTATNATPAGSDQCLVVNRATPNVAKTFGAASINDAAATTLVFTLANQGSNPSQSGIALGDTLPTGLALNSATPAVAYSVGCSGPATASYNSGTRVLSGLTGIAMTSGTASCTVTVAGLTNQATQVNASCAGNPAAFTNLAANVTATGANNTSSDQCLVVNRVAPGVAKTFGAASIADGASTTLVFTLANAGTNPAQPGIAVGDTLPTGLALNSATPAVAYSAGCSGPASASYNSGTRVLSGLTGVAMASGTASCTVTVAGLTNQASQVNASCAGNPAAFTNLAANVTATNATPGGSDQCLVVTAGTPTVAKTFGASSINDGATTTLVFTLANGGTHPAQSGIALGDTLPVHLQMSSTTPAVSYSAGCSGPATAAYNSGTRVLSGLTGIAIAAGTASCTVTVAGLTNQNGQANPSCASTPTAFTNQASNVTATNATNVSTDQCLVVNVQSPNVAKTFGAASIADGGTTTLVFTLANAGTNPAQSGIAVGDTLPTGLALGSTTPAVSYSAGCSGPANAAYNAGTRVLSGLTGIAMTSGTVSCTVTVAGLTNAASQVNASCAGNPAAFTNAAVNVTTTAANNVSTDQCLVVTRSSPALAKAFSPTPIDQGGTSTLVFTITNSGTHPAQSGVGFVDTLPAGVTVAGTPNVQSSCPAGGALVPNPAFVATAPGSITVAGAALNAGVASCEIRVNVTSATAGTYSNTEAANLSGQANLTTTGVSAQLVVQALPTIAKAFGASSVGLGQTTTLAFTLDNSAGTVSRSGLVFSDALPAGLETANPPVATASAGCVSPTLAGTANTSTTVGASSVGVNAGQTCVITFTVRGTTLGTKTNDAASVATTGLVNNVTPQLLTVVQASLDKAFNPASIAAGGTSTLVFTLTNGTGNPAEAGIGFTDSLPGNVRVAATPSVLTNCPAGGALGAAGFSVTAAAGTSSITVAGASISGGVASCQVRVDVTSAIGGAYTNDAARIGGTANVTNAVAGTTLTVTGAGPSVAKSFAPTPIAAGAVSTLTLTLSNPNASASSLTAAFTDTLPTGLVVANPANAGTSCTGTGAVAASPGGSTVTLPATRSLPAASGLTPGSCTVTVDVTAALGGTYTNTVAAGALATSNGSNASPASADLVVTTAAPTIAKSFAPSSIAAGATSTLTLTLSNGNTTAASLSAALTDNLPSGVVIAATPNAGTTCAGSGSVTAGAGTTTITLPATRSIPAGSGATAGTCTVTVDVTSSVGGSYTNTIGAGALQTSNGTNAAAASAGLTVATVAPTLAKAFGTSPVNANTPSTLTITLTNANATAAALTAALTDTLPTPVVVAPTPNASTTCAGGGAVVAAAGTSSITLPATRSIPAAVGATAGSCTITVDVVSPAGGSFTNTLAASALQTSNGSNANPASATLVVNAVAPAIAKAFSPASIAADGTSTITFTISNANVLALTSASFGDTLAAMSVSGAQAAGGTCAGAGSNSLANGQTGAIALSGLTIPAASGATPGSCTVTMVVTSDIPGAHDDQAGGVSSAQAPTGAASNIATLTVAAASATIAKSFTPPSIAYGGTSTITFTLGNTNGVALTGAAFTDTLTGMSASGAQTAGGTCTGASGNSFANGQSGALAFGGLTIPANGTCTVTLLVTSVTAGTLPNQASGVSSNEAPTGAASNVASLTVTATALTVGKAFAPAAINSGGVATLTITVTNPNAAAVTGLSLTDNFPATPGTGLARAATPNASTTCAGGTVSSTATSVTLSGASLGAGASCTFQVDVTAASAGTYTNTIPAGAVASSAGSNTAAASRDLTVNPVANLAIAKLGPASAGTGSPVSYSITVSNAGPDAANGATFSDNVPAGITGVTASCTGASGGAACGAMNVAGNSVTSTIPTLPAGGTVSITVSGTASGVGSITNTATIAAPSGVTDPVAGNNSASASTSILAPDLVIAKSHAGNFTVGTNGAYTITVSNAPGSLATTGTITVTDSLPAGLGFVSASGTGWSCSFAAPTVTCTTSASIAAGSSAAAITLTVSVGSTAVPSVTNFATVGGGGEPAGTTGNNTASDNTIVVAAGVNVFQPDGAQTGMPGTTVSYPHTFNAGNAGTVTFSTSAVTTPAVPGWTQQIYRDLDCNGVLNGAEGASPLSGPVAVNAGDTVCIVVRDNIPGTAPYNAQNAISVTASASVGGAVTRSDTTTVGSAAGAGLVLAKSVRNVTLGSGVGTSNTARPNDVLEYTITYTNTSSGLVSAIVITDATPAFTTFLSAACGAPLPASLSACAVTSQPAVNGAGSVVWTLTGSLLSSGSGTVVYQVRVAP